MTLVDWLSSGKWRGCEVYKGPGWFTVALRWKPDSAKLGHTWMHADGKGGSLEEAMQRARTLAERVEASK